MTSPFTGIFRAALWGVIIEAAILLFFHITSDASILRSYRVVRLGEMALATAAVAVALSLPIAALPPIRAAVRGRFASWVAAWGFALPIWLTVAFHLVPLGADAVKLTQDPLVRRVPMMIVGALAMVAVPPVFWAITRSVEKRVAWVQSALALLLGAVLLIPTWGADNEGEPRRPDILLFSVDTLRADHLGCYGYERETSPELDGLCREAIVFDRAMAPAPYTIPSYASILTGLLQRDHGVYSNYQKLDDDVVTLPERLAEAGYRTAAIIDGSFPGTFANLDQGFDLVVQRGVVARSPIPSLSESAWSLYRALLSLVSEFLNLDLSVTTDAAERWLREQPTEGPTFVHFYWPFPHQPYQPPPEHLKSFPLPIPGDLDTERIRAYDGEIRFMDAQLARLFGVLRDLGWWDEAWVVFTSDHGEELGRPVPDRAGGTMNYWGHSRYLYDSSLRVPLVVRPPLSRGLGPQRADRVVTTASIAATLLDAAGVPRPDNLITPLPLEPGTAYDQVVVSVSRSTLKPVDIVSVRTSEWRLIETRKPEPSIELYRYQGKDESAELSAKEREIVDELLRKLRAVEPEGTVLKVDEKDISITDRERKRLEALGYIE